MARQPNTDRFIEQASLTEVPGRVNSESLDGISSNTLQPGVSLVKALKSGKVRGRGPSPSGDGKTEKGTPEGDRKLSDSPASSNPFRQSENILQTIADHFVEARKLQKAEAWRQLQVDLMHASPYICPVVIPYKDLISIVSEIEKEIKGGTSQAGLSNEEIMANFLSGEGTLVITKMDLAPASVKDTNNKELDKPAIVSTGGGEDGPVTDIPLSNGPSIPPLAPPST